MGFFDSIGDWFKGAGNKVWGGIKDAGNAIYNKVLTPIYHKVLKPVYTKFLKPIVYEKALKPLYTKIIRPVVEKTIDKVEKLINLGDKLTDNTINLVGGLSSFLSNPIVFVGIGVVGLVVFLKVAK
jgi:hypothetical protein